MPGIAGLRGTGDWSADERPKSFRESILFFNPNGDAPIFALTSKAGKRVVSDPDFSWWAEANAIVRLQVNGAHSSTATTINVDSSDPTASNMGAPYGHATHLKAGDLLLVEKADQVTFDNEVIMVESVISDAQFTVRRGVAGTTAAAIPDDTFLTLIGSSYAEGTAAPKAVGRNPIKFYNLVQIFKDTYEITGTADKTEARTGSAWSNDKKRKLFQHAAGIEFAFLFGRRHETIGDNGKPLRFMGGLRDVNTGVPASNTTVFSAPVTASTFLNAVAPAFDHDVGGGDTRIAFCGNLARLELAKVIQAETGVRIMLGSPIKVYGVDFQEFITPLGRILIKSHPLLSRHDRFKRSMFVLDFSAIKYVTVRGRPDGTIKDDVQAKDEDVRRGYIQTDCSLMVDAGGLTQAYLGNISAT